MPKADADPRERDVAAGGSGATSSSDEQGPNMKSREAGTAPDDIPPVHVLEAAQNQDRKETEDLLAGFDRPGRGPQRPSVERDFVDYYAKKKSPGTGSGPVRLMSRETPSAATPSGPRQIDVSTVVVPRNTAGMPAWLVWSAAAALMLIVGGAVAFLATSDAQPSKADATTGPSAATTITAASPPPRASVDPNIPPPSDADRVDPSAVATTPVMVESAAPVPVPIAPRPSGKRGPGPNVNTNASAGGAVSVPPSATTNEATKPAPRNDLIRDL